MKIYDIVENTELIKIEHIIEQMKVRGDLLLSNQLNEADYSVVSVGTGRNRTFNIVDTQTGAVVGNERVRGTATSKARDLAARSATPAPQSDTPSRDTPSRDTPTANANSRIVDAARTKVRTFFARVAARGNWLFRIIPGFYMAYDTYKEQQTSAYENYLLGAYGELGSRAAQDEYRRVSGALHVAFLTEAIGLWLAGMATARVAHGVIRGIRTAFTAAGAITGPLGAAIGWIIGEGITYGVMWLISRESFAKQIIGMYINWDGFMELMLDQDGDLGVIPSSARAIAAAAVNNPGSRAIGADLDAARDMDPQGRLINQGVAQTQQQSNSTGNAQPAAGNRLLNLPAFD
jgi:hypothetical protein